jgi:hypothetical protein
MAYSKQTWQDENPAYPVSADRMAHIENGIEAAANVADEAAAAAAAGGGGGASNIIFSPTEPTATPPWIWYQTDPDTGEVIDILIET